MHVDVLARQGMSWPTAFRRQRRRWRRVVQGSVVYLLVNSGPRGGGLLWSTRQPTAVSG